MNIDKIDKMCRAWTMTEWKLPLGTRVLTRAREINKEFVLNNIQKRELIEILFSQDFSYLHSYLIHTEKENNEISS